jgi:hypothetical protein
VRVRLRAHALEKTMTDRSGRSKWVTHTGQAEVHQGSYSLVRIEEKIRRLDVTVNDASRVNIPQCTKHAPEVRSYPDHRKRVIE